MAAGTAVVSSVTGVAAAGSATAVALTVAGEMIGSVEGAVGVGVAVSAFFEGSTTMCRIDGSVDESVKIRL